MSTTTQSVFGISTDIHKGTQFNTTALSRVSEPIYHCDHRITRFSTLQLQLLYETDKESLQIHECI
jgi:hypothetical protein